MAIAWAAGGILIGTLAERNALATVQIGQVCITTDAGLNRISRVASIGPVVWVDYTDLLIKQLSETVTQVVPAAGAATVNCALGTVFYATAAGAVTWTFSNPMAAGKCTAFTLILTNGGVGAQTWPVSVDWPGGLAPALTAAGIDILIFFTIDGGTIWNGNAGMKDVKTP